MSEILYWLGTIVFFGPDVVILAGIPLYMWWKNRRKK